MITEKLKLFSIELTREVAKKIAIYNYNQFVYENSLLEFSDYKLIYVMLVNVDTAVLTTRFDFDFKFKCNYLSREIGPICLRISVFQRGSAGNINTELKIL